MSPFVAYHTTMRRHRDNIRTHGLIAGSPGARRPFGVYVFREDCGHPTFSRGQFTVWWSHYKGQADLWEVAYIGPMIEDAFVSNGYVFLDSIPPSNISLITHTTGNI